MAVGGVGGWGGVGWGRKTRPIYRYGLVFCVGIGGGQTTTFCVLE